MATYNVNSGQTSTGKTLGSGDVMNVKSAGKANKTTVNTFGLLVVSKGGTATSTTLSGFRSGGVVSYGTIDVYGAANINTISDGGRVVV